jgi:hypothetical protein
MSLKIGNWQLRGIVSFTRMALLSWWEIGRKGLLLSDGVLLF